MEDEDIIDMQRENSALSNNKIKKQILNDYKDDFNNKNKRKQKTHELHKNNDNHNNNGNIYMIKTFSKDIIVKSNKYKTNLQTRVKKSHENIKRIKNLEISKTFKK